MNIRHSLVALFTCCLLLPQPGRAQDAEKAKQIASLIQDYRDHYGFTGAVLVSENLRPLHKALHGPADPRTSAELQATHQFNLGQASEQFTAIAIVMLRELGKLKYEDEITKYLPELDYSGVTIRHLLTHTSGIPDYTKVLPIYWNDKNKLATNRDLLYVYKKQSPAAEFRAGEHRAYSATNYALLASVVQRVSGVEFDQFVQRYLLEPLGMKNTLVHNRLRYPTLPNRVGSYRTYYIKPATPDESSFMDGIVGDKNLYTTLDDLMQWDAALYSERLAKLPMLNEAFAPTELNNGSVVNYGFGWELGMVDRRKVATAYGTQGGYRVVYERLLEDKDAIIILNHTGNAYIENLKEGIYAILKGRSPKMPQRSIAAEMARTMQLKSFANALTLYSTLKERKSAEFTYRESELNTLGIELLELGRKKDAIEVLKLNAEAYPASFNVYDSLAEAYLADGNTAEAIAHYKKSLEMYPDNQNAQAMLKRLAGGK